jgi:hypothetical protein
MKPSRNHAAVGTMLAGLVAGPAGALIQWGPGAALLVASGLLIALALILGWKSA